MAPHIDPPTHQNPFFHSFFPSTFSNSIPLHPPHPRITNFISTSIPSIFHHFFQPFRPLFRIFNQPATWPPRVQIFSIPLLYEHTNSPRPPKSHRFPLKTSTDFATFFTSPLTVNPSPAPRGRPRGCPGGSTVEAMDHLPILRCARI